jgi:hypothetical protein
MAPPIGRLSTYHWGHFWLLKLDPLHYELPLKLLSNLMVWISLTLCHQDQLQTWKGPWQGRYPYTPRTGSWGRFRPPGALLYPDIVKVS